MKNKKLLLGIGLGALVLVLVGGLAANSSGLFQGKIRNTSSKAKVAVAPMINTDYDRDGLTNQQEANINTNPLKSDTDGDGYNDQWEVSRGCDPLISGLNCSPDADADGDLLSRWVETFLGTDLANPDTDGDGYSDGVEVGEAYQVEWGETPSFIDPQLVSDPLNPCDPSTTSPACTQ